MTRRWGSTMLWLAIDSETKLAYQHHVGARNVSTLMRLFVIFASVLMAAIR